MAQNLPTSNQIVHSDSTYTNTILQVVVTNLEANITSAYNQANSAYVQANNAPTAYGQANVAYGQANLAYAAANSAQTQANTIYAQANLIYGLANVGQTSIFVAGSLIANNPNINFAVANSSNLSIVGTSNTVPGNVTITFDTRVAGGGGGGGSPPASPNLSIQVNNAGTIGGTANLLMNLASNNMFIEANVQLANGSPIYFGGKQSNVANALYSISYNASATSLDFFFY